MSEPGSVRRRRGFAAAGPRIGVVGMGQVGPGIASAFRAAGHHLSGVAVRRAESEERADAALPAVPLKSAEDVARDSDVLLLAVGDREIEPLTKQLVDAGAIHPGQAVIHFAGPMGLEPLASAAAVGALPIALHPVMNFTGTSLDVHRLQGTPIAYTASAVAEPLAITLIESIGAIPFAVQGSVRGEYDLVLSSAADDLASAVAAAVLALENLGVDHPQTVLGPMLQETLSHSLATDDFDADDLFE